MRIRKRTSQSVAPASAHVTPSPPQPILFKYHQATSNTAAGSPGRDSSARFRGSKAAAECSNMQENRSCLEDGDDHEAPASPQSSSDVYAEPPAMEANHRLSDSHVKDDHSDGDLSGSLEDDVKVADKERRKKQSPTKRRKIEHESRLLFEGASEMTAAELLAVTELVNGVRQRLAASEHSTSEVQVPIKTPPTKPVENSKDALISSIFYVFDVCGENGLSASEVVKYMLDHRLPGLKEGGARHTVQVANVLRSSSSFISLGDKKYLLCSSLDAKNHESSSRKPPTGSTRQVPNIKIIAPASPQSGSDGKDSSDDELAARTLNSTLRRGSKSRPTTDKANAHSNTRSGKKVQAEKPKSSVTPPAPTPAVQDEPKPEARSDDGEAEPVVVKTTRRRGPSSSQKGKGPTQCKRYDGRGWQCSRLTEPGYSLCVHHQDLINKRAAKLKEQQTLNRLMESQNRKLAKSQSSTPAIVDTPKPVTANTTVVTDSINATASRDHRDNVRDRDSGAPVQKRKMLSLLAIK